jgi:hypothetical protein
MKTSKSLLLTALLLGAIILHSPAAKADRYVVGFQFCDGYPGEVIHHAVPIYGSVRDVAVRNPARSDYQPHLTADYRVGYWAGRNDAACGWSRNYRRAFVRSGCQWESYFQEGYADGFSGSPMRH